MQGILNAFRPNRPLESRTWVLLVGSQLLLAFLLWRAGGALMIPDPLKILAALGRLLREDALLYELFISMKTSFQALAISAVLSLGLSYLTVLPFFQPVVGLLTKLRFSGMTGLVVVFTLAFGGGSGLKVAIMTFGITTFFLTSMAAVVSSVPRADFDHARSLRMGGWRSVWEVVVLGRADEAFEVLRQNAAIGWVMLTMVEGLVRTEGGIGAMMLNQMKHFHMDAVFAIWAVIILFGAVQDRAIVWLKSACCPCASLTLERK